MIECIIPLFSAHLKSPYERQVLYWTALFTLLHLDFIPYNALLERKFAKHPGASINNFTEPKNCYRFVPMIWIKDTEPKKKIIKIQNKREVYTRSYRGEGGLGGTYKWVGFYRICLSSFSFSPFFLHCFSSSSINFLRFAFSMVWKSESRLALWALGKMTKFTHTEDTQLVPIIHSRNFAPMLTLNCSKESMSSQKTKWKLLLPSHSSIFSSKKT